MTNNHAQHRLGHTLIILGSFMLLIFATILAPVSTAGTRAFGISDIIKGSNDARVQLNERPLIANSDLMNAAQMKAEDMVKGRFFAHTAPDGTVAWDYFRKVGYNYEYAGENLAITNESSESVINGWLNSQTHRDNLLNSNYSDLGVGMAAYGDYEGHKNTYVIVALYGKRTGGEQVLAAPTSPAGGTTALKPQLINIPPAAIVAFASVLILSGILLEARHLKHLHNSKTIA